VRGGGYTLADCLSPASHGPLSGRHGTQPQMPDCLIRALWGGKQSGAHSRKSQCSSCFWWGSYLLSPAPLSLPSVSWRSWLCMVSQEPLLGKHFPAQHSERADFAPGHQLASPLLLVLKNSFSSVGILAPEQARPSDLVPPSLPHTQDRYLTLSCPTTNHPFLLSSHLH
jgi:hypothetical protein